MRGTKTGCAASIQVGLLGLTLIAFASCGEKPPEAHPVRGKVVFKGRGGNVQRLEGGKVWFRSTSDLSQMSVGVIEDDGTFSMATFSEGKGVSGVSAGQYQARVAPPLDDERKPTPGIIHPRYENFDTSGLSFTVPVPGEIIIEVAGPFH